MSSNNPSSGVRNLRAMFEGAKGSTTPPSRGRSPTGSDSAVTSGPRPLSKVRTSFVAVERSGQMASQLGLKKVSSGNEGGGGGGDSGSDSKDVADSEKVNGVSVEPSSRNKSQDGTTTATSIGEAKEGEGTTKDEDASTLSSKDDVVAAKQTLPSNETKDASQTADQTTSTTMPSDAKDGKMTVGESALPQEPENLGSLLKGSAFEENPAEGQHSAQPESSNMPAAAENKEVRKGKPASKITSKAKASSKPSAYGDAAKTVHPNKTAPSQNKPLSTRPTAISTKRDITGPKPSSKPSTTTTAAKSPQTPETPKTPVTPKRQPLSTTVSPRQPITPKEVSKPPARKPSRTQLGTTTTTSHAIKPRQPPASTNVPKKLAKTSPEGKTRPKSPTRPVRLPASATAPTASSVARVGGGGPAAPPSRINTTTLARKPSTLNKDHKPSAPRTNGTAASHLQKKPSRVSLPAQNGHERPKSRVSIAGSKAPDGGFLARMMRPTASSAQKTHEKVEPKTPPKKNATAKPKSKSDGTDEAGKHKEDDAHEQVHQQSGLLDTASSPTEEHETKESEEPANHAAALNDAIAV